MIGFNPAENFGQRESVKYSIQYIIEMKKYCNESK